MNWSPQCLVSKPVRVFASLCLGAGCFCPRASAAAPDVASPLASYQYLDTVANTPSQSNILSAVVSYQRGSPQTTTPSYNLVDLGTLGGTSSAAYGINNSGQVVGWANLAGDSNYHAFKYSGGSMQDLGSLSGGNSTAYGINSFGRVVGSATTNSASNNTHAFLYSNGSMQDLGTLGGPSSYASGINANGQVVGAALPNTNIPIHAFLYSNGSMQDLDPMAGDSGSANAINDSGQAVGYIATGGFVSGQAFLYNNGSRQDIGTLGGAYSAANAINDVGQVAGSASTTNYPNSHAFLFSCGSTRDLGTLGGNNSTANGLNSAGQVVGYSYINTTSLYTHAFLYSNGSMLDLNDLIVSAGNWSLNGATAINDTGQIVGYGLNPSNQLHAFLLNPLPLGPQIITGPANQFVRTGDTATFSVVAEGQPLPTYQWQFDGGALPGATTATLSLANVQPANAGDYTVIISNAYGSVTSSTAQLFILPQIIDKPPPLPTYGICPLPEPNKDSLVLVTHGWINLDIETIPQAIAFITPMSNSIVQSFAALGMGNWQVAGYLWPDKAAYPLWFGMGPVLALYNAEQEGKMLGDQIASKGTWKHIHFIAHSAGAGLIQKATEQIRSSLPNTVIHCTFLDAFDGALGGEAGEYGSHSTWADSYFVRDMLQWVGWTGRLLPNAYNVDVTTLDPQAAINQLPGYVSSANLGTPCYETESSHGWPIDFYANSLMSDLSSVYHGGDYGEFGFKLSEEAGNWASALTLFPPGNGTTGNSTPTKILGPQDPACSEVLTVTPPSYTGSAPTFVTSSTAKSTTGTIQTFTGGILMGTESPVWVATVVTDTNALNLLSFDANFTSAQGSRGLLSIYWDTNMIGLLDEIAVQPGFQHYTLSFPRTAADTSHVLGFRLDPLTSVQSAVALTNIVTGCVGVSQPFLLRVTTNMSNGLLVYQLAGQPGTYAVQTSADLLNWTTVAILANTNGRVNFIDPNSTNYNRRFYRAVAP